MLEQHGQSVVEFLPWDSQFFQFKVARVIMTRLTSDLCEKVLSWCRTNSIRCLYYEADLSDFESLRTAADAGFIPVDVRTVLDFRFAATPAERKSFGPSMAGCAVRPAHLPELPCVKAIARQIGEVSRFHLDPHFQPGASGEMYALWVQKIYDAMSGVVLVSLRGEQVAGFIACDRQGDVGKIELVGVHSDFQGCGIGNALVKASLGWFCDQNCLKTEVVTQGRNIAALRMYQKAGFRTASATLLYHRWFD
jgi:ribosomal protein S18 acetylase RimI-like enzyme